MYKTEVEVAKSIALMAGDIMREYFWADQGREIKEDGTPLTIADTMINSVVIRELAEHFPNDIVIGEEESTGDYSMGRRWFCDPIDGTKAFTWGVPTAMFSLALVVDGKPVLGVCYEPMLDVLYYAVQGGRAYRNDDEIHVNIADLSTGILGTISSQWRIRNEASYLDPLLENHDEMAAFSGAVAKIVRVAEGRFVGYIEELANAHDIAAAQVILEAAGGVITSLHGEPLDYSKPFKGIVSSNTIVHNELVTICRKAYEK